MVQSSCLRGARPAKKRSWTQAWGLQGTRLGRFFRACGETTLAEDPRVTDPLKRSEHIDWLYQEIARLAVTKTTAEWVELLHAEDIPCAPINSLDDLFSDNHLSSVGMFETRHTKHSGEIRSIRSPFIVNGKVSSAYRPDLEPPRLGEHSDS